MVTDQDCREGDPLPTGTDSASPLLHIRRVDAHYRREG